MADAVFLALSVITIGSAIAALELRSLIYGSIALMGKLGGIALMLVFMVALGSVIMDSGIKTITTNEPAVDFRSIGADFLTYYWPALILMALILTGSVTGALILARREDVENDQRTD